MNWGQLKAQVFKLMDEYSSRGVVQSKAKTQDVTFKAQDFARDTILELAKVVKNPGVFTVSLSDENSPLQYNLPEDWLELNYAGYTQGQRLEQVFPTGLFRITPDRRLILAPNRHPSEIRFYYVRRPVDLIFTGDDAADEAQTIDLPEDAARIAAYNVAGQVLLSEGELTKGTMLINQYEAKKENLVIHDGKLPVEITDALGWWA
ncbi:hypothetical protein [Desulforamulus ruminis]|uniref:Uncharacterized protein n=1 Tax=Desulforamulus ruminis (strain ATCC 23193 / DSM 2154 / NCIMB 8452 / DL) TaxID=696281 RepID=F6DM27_DESRL|nr:hypothetical protein [Desulforamulus ruminis]AEG59369.1 hypothetical protein Desru_1094 [Desulforamulus ruminis DSM 2154]